jgi:GT2 family glycosyltransferase
MSAPTSLHRALATPLAFQDLEMLAQSRRELRKTKLRVRDRSLGLRACLSELQNASPPEYPRVEALSPIGWAEPPMVSVIIPTRGDQKIIRNKLECLPELAIRSLLSVTSYPKYEIVVVLDVPHRGSASFEEVLQDHRVRVVPYHDSFSFSDKCNTGFVHTESDVVIFLNDDTEIIDPQWMEKLVSSLSNPAVGLVGPLLLLEDGRVQSAGHAMSPSPRNLHAGVSTDDPRLKTIVGKSNQVSGLTAACVAIRSQVYEAAGGMSDALPINFNDVDLGLKLTELGYVHLLRGDVLLYHFESLTRATVLEEADEPTLRARWGRYFTYDPFVDELSSQQ